MRQPVWLIGLVLTGVGQGAYAQSAPLPPADTTDYWHTWVRKREKQLQLPPIKPGPGEFHCRLSYTGGTVLDSWQQQGQWVGRLTLWVRNTDERLGRYEWLYKQQYELSAQQASAVGRVLRTSGLLALPSDKAIKGWRQGTDGSIFTVQLRDSSRYTYKTYWSPWAQHDLAAARLVAQVENQLLDLVSYQLIHRLFVEQVPFNCFGTDGMAVTCVYKSQQLYWQRKNQVSRYVRQQRRQR